MADRVVATVTRAWGGTDGRGLYYASNVGTTHGGGPSQASQRPYDTVAEAQRVCQNAWAGRPLRWVAVTMAGIPSWEGHLEV